MERQVLAPCYDRSSLFFSLKLLSGESTRRFVSVWNRKLYSAFHVDNHEVVPETKPLRVPVIVLKSSPHLRYRLKYLIKNHCASCYSAPPQHHFPSPVMNIPKAFDNKLFRELSDGGESIRVTGAYINPDAVSSPPPPARSRCLPEVY